MRLPPHVPAPCPDRDPPLDLYDQIGPLPPDRPVLIAGPTASGKSALALDIARRQGGVIINADASQVYGCWRVVTARPDPEEEMQAPHRLYGHVDWRRRYSTGDWLREVEPVLHGPDRPIIVGGTGLYFLALTEGLADVPPVPQTVRDRADGMAPEAMIAELDPATAARIDLHNPARIRRAWEVLKATGQGLAAWQDMTPPPVLPVATAAAFVLETPKDWLEARIFARFDHMVAQGALDEVAAMAAHDDPALPAFRAIGVPELMAHVRGEISLDEARRRTAIATRQFAKRQRTWFRARMGAWRKLRAGPPQP